MRNTETADQILASKVERGIDFFDEVKTQEVMRVIRALPRGVCRGDVEAVGDFNLGKLTLPRLLEILGLEEDPNKLEKADRIINRVEKFHKNMETRNAYEDVTAVAVASS